MATIRRSEELNYAVLGVDIPVLGVAVEADTFEEAYEAAKREAHDWCREKVLDSMRMMLDFACMRGDDDEEELYPYFGGDNY